VRAVTTDDAHDLGIPVIELGKLAHRGKLEHVSYGLYRFPDIPLSDRAPYMEAVLWVGRDAAHPPQVINRSKRTLLAKVDYLSSPIFVDMDDLSELLESGEVDVNAALRRVAAKDDIRSNIHAGAKAAAAEIGTVELEVANGSERRSFDIRLGAAPDASTRPFIGIEMSPDDFEPIEYEFKTGRIAGPSAGLMFALALYDRLTPEDLTGGRKIAGTGEIACDGSIGPIGGIEQIVAGAEARNAEIFLAPAGNADGAREVADDIRIVAVGSFQDAVDHLESLD
jgi:hypothetical protein